MVRARESPITGQRAPDALLTQQINRGAMRAWKNEKEAAGQSAKVPDEYRLVSKGDVDPPSRIHQIATQQLPWSLPQTVCQNHLLVKIRSYVHYQR